MDDAHLSLREIIVKEFTHRYGERPSIIIRAPGRVNLIGEHTDYNDGFVLPMAIDRFVWLALRPRTDGHVRLHSLDFAETAVFDLNNIQHTNAGWIEYVKGTAWVLQQRGFELAGWDGVMTGNIPIGAGLSSSAALEIATARAFQAISHWPWVVGPMALVGQSVENEWIGVNSGIMDQMICAAGQSDHALLIDCRSLETEAVPLPPATAVVIMDTATRRGLVDSAYNARRQQCEAAAHFFGVPALRDVTPEAFAAKSDQLTPLIRQRARHVISENARVLESVAAMRQHDAVRLGRLMNNSHASLRDDFAVSSAELDLMVSLAQEQDACYGARMTGAGFGGCAVAVVTAVAAPSFTAKVAQLYEESTHRQPDITICQAADGAMIINIENVSDR